MLRPLCFRWGPVLYCGPSLCMVWLRTENDGKQQESPSTFCLTYFLSVCLFLFTHILSLFTHTLSRWWLGCGQGDSQSPSFLSPASPSGPVRNSLVILGFCRFDVGPQFKTTSFSSLLFIQAFTRMFSETSPTSNSTVRISTLCSACHYCGFDSERSRSQSLHSCL